MRAGVQDLCLERSPPPRERISKIALPEREFNGTNDTRLLTTLFCLPALLKILPWNLSVKKCHLIECILPSYSLRANFFLLFSILWAISAAFTYIRKSTVIFHKQKSRFSDVLYYEFQR